MKNNWRNWDEGTKVIYHGENASFKLDNEYAKEKLIVGKIYTVDYTLEDKQYDVNNCVCLKEDTVNDWDVLLFDTIEGYIEKLIKKHEPVYITMCNKKGYVISKFNLVKNVSRYDKSSLSIYNVDNVRIGYLYESSLSSIGIDARDNILIYLNI